MRYIHVNSLVIDSQLPTIWVDGKELSIEPKLHALLLLFIDHANNIVTRDQIIDIVNQGVIVSDNAVNKMVANLRQVLKDNPKSPRFIKTIPKQGYCFIAELSRQESLMTIGQSGVGRSNSYSGYAIACFATLCILLLGWWQFTPNQHDKNSFQRLELQPLTRHSGVEFAPVVSPDQQFLAYTRNDPVNEISELWVRRLDGSETEFLISNLVTSSEMAWSSDSKRLLFTDYPDQTCQLKQVNIQEPAAIDNIGVCNALYISQIAFVENDEAIIYVAREVGFDPMQIYRYQFSDKSRTLIKQPIPTGSGNYGFDLSADKKKMLILSADEGSCHTSVFVLNRQNNDLENKGRWDRFVSRAIWHHDNETVINTTNEFSHELVQSQLNGDTMTTLVSTSNRVAENFTRFPNGRDYYFTSFQMNNDNELVDLSTGTIKRTFNSAVYDKLPTFSKNTKQWYFLSKRNGLSQIFMGDESSKQLTQLTQFDSEPQIDLLDVSPDGKTILMGGRKQLMLMSLDGNNITNVNIEQGFAIASNWLTNDRLAVTVLKNGGQPELLYYDINAKLFSTTKGRWQAAFSDTTGQQLFMIESGTNEIYQWFAQQQVYKTTTVKLGWTYGNGLDVIASDNALIYMKRGGAKSEIIRHTLNGHGEETLGEWLYIAGFDVRDNQLLISYEQGRSGDILKTNFQ